MPAIARHRSSEASSPWARPFSHPHLGPACISSGRHGLASASQSTGGRKAWRRAVTRSRLVMTASRIAFLDVRGAATTRCRFVEGVSRNDRADRHALGMGRALERLCRGRSRRPAASIPAAAPGLPALPGTAVSRVGPGHRSRVGLPELRLAAVPATTAAGPTERLAARGSSRRVGARPPWRYVAGGRLALHAGRPGSGTTNSSHFHYPAAPSSFAPEMSIHVLGP